MPALSPAVGILLVVLAAFSFSASPSLARLAYDGGSDAGTVTLARFLLGAILTLALLYGRGGGLPKDRRVLLWGLGIGLVYAIQSFAYMGSVLFVPVGIAVLVFFLFPVFVALFAWLIDKMPLSGARWAAVFGAFSGVALTTGAAPELPDPRGVGLALIAALFTAVYIIYGSRLSKEIGSLTYSGLTFTTASLLFLLWTAVGPGVALPGTLIGWIGLIGSAVCFVVGILAFFAALTVIDTVKASLVCNLEPLFAIAIAFLLLGELLTPVQLVGVVVVVGAILLSDLGERLASRRRPARPVPEETPPPHS